MSFRIITKGLTTGAGPGGVRFILRRGLSSIIQIARRQSIVNQLTFLLSTITVNRGFKTDLGLNVFEWKGNNFQESELPGVDIRDISEDVEVKGGRHLYKLQIEIEAKVSATTSTQDARSVMADITTLIGRNFNLNNLAHKITPVDNELLDFEKGNKSFGTILLRFEVEYATKAFQPYS